MRGALSILLLVCAAVAQAPPSVPPDCPDRKTDCATPDAKQARPAFERGLELARAGRSQEAFAAFDQAAQLAPKNLQYLTAREAFRQRVVLEHLQRGNNFLLANQSVEAMAEFRMAAELDPANAYAKARLTEAVVPPDPTPRILRVEESDVVELAPAAGSRNFHYRGDARGLLQQIAGAYGLKVVFDESVPSRSLRFDLEGADFSTAMGLAAQMTKTFWTPLSSTEMLVAADTAANRRQFERLGLRTFYLQSAASPKEMTELVALIRTLFEVRYLAVQPESRSIQVRAPQPVLEALTRFLEGLEDGRPQVEMTVEVLEVARTADREIGTELPLQFQIINIPSAALQLAATPDVQALINQLIQSGGINEANSQAVAALLAQLQGSSNSLLGQPIATFGGGSTLFGVIIPPASANISFNESRLTSLENATLRTAEGDAATLKVGTRYPILNASFAPILNSAALTQAIQNNSFQTAFPSFQYEDLGMVLKATPHLHSGTDDISLQLDLQLSALTATSVNGIPILANRKYTGAITLKTGETAVVAGRVERSEQRMLAGLPGLGRIPLLGRLTANERVDHTLNELVILVTPRVARRPEQNLANQEFWLPPIK